MTVRSCATEQTEALGARLGAALLQSGAPRAFVALFGEMGVGKTAFTRGLCASLGIRAVRSPTYTVVNEYRSGVCPVFHFDFYRMEEEDELISIGYEDYLKAEGICITEWSEKFPHMLPPDAIRVTVLRGDAEDCRLITVEGIDL